jgi:hypothetical protein
MSGSETLYPPFLSPVIEVFVKALILAEEEGAPEIGVDHLLAALDSPTTESKPVESQRDPLYRRYIGTRLFQAKPRQP